MKILIGEFRQESNSFNPVLSTMEFWEKSGIYEGKEVEEILGNRPCAVAGMIQAVREEQTRWEKSACAGPEKGQKSACARAETNQKSAHLIEQNPPNQGISLVCGLAMSCQSGGPAHPSVLEYFLERFTESVRENLPLDGVFLSFHGALQTPDFDDAEGEILRQVRRLTGEKTVLAVSTDLHAYLSPLMTRTADIICGYHTYPHMDYFETGYRAAKLGLDCICPEGNRPRMVQVTVPMIVSAASYTTLHGPFRDLMEYAKSLEEQGDMRDFSIYQMQPWLDIAEGGSSVVVIGEDGEEGIRRSRELALDLAGRLYGLRKKFQSHIYSIDQVIDLAKEKETPKPVILVDSADSCNAGATGDSMAAAIRILERGEGLKAATVVNDPKAADLAHRLGVGATAMFRLGGARDSKAAVLEREGVVVSLHDGDFVQEGPAGKGLVNHIGPTAVLRFGALDVVVCHWMAGNGDPQLYRAFGIDPVQYDLVVVKACTSFRSAYEPISGAICETDTPGAASVNLLSLDFRKLSKELYPWSDPQEDRISEITLGHSWAPTDRISIK